MAFATTMLVLLGIMTVMLFGAVGVGGGGLTTVMDNGLRMASAHTDAVNAGELAEAGVELTLAWLHAQSSPPSSTVPFAPSLWGGTASGSPQRTLVDYPVAGDASHQFSVIIYPSSTNGSGGDQEYMIESIGTSNAATRIVRAWVQTVSLCDYLYLSDNSSSAFWIDGVSTFDGPVHCNNSNGNTTNIIWKTGSSQPMFLDTATNALTVSGSGILWCLNSPSTQQIPQSTSDWSGIATSGQSSVHVGTPVVPLPTSTTAEMNAALGGTTVPTQTGVTVPNGGLGLAPTGGIYIHGNVSQLTFTALPDINGSESGQEITVSQTGTAGLPLTTVIDIDPALDTTTYLSTQITSLLPLKLAGVYVGMPNGVIYCDGDIGSLSGTVYSGGVSGTIADNEVTGGKVVHTTAWTIATAPTGLVAIDGNLEYNTQRQTSNGLPIAESSDSNFTLNAGTLGIVSGNIEIGAEDSGTTPTSVQVDAALLALDTCEAADHSMTATGTFVSNGLFVTESTGSFGSVNSAGSLTSGYATTRHYDQRLQTSPPPDFPSYTGTYNVLSWRTATSLLDQ